MNTGRAPSRVTEILMLFAIIAGLLSSCTGGNTPLVTGTNGLPWWNDTTFYEVFVRSFMDSNGDGIGDFNGLTSKLDYFTGLGIKGIWLMPINPSPSYHGYDVSDYYSVNPAYGTMEDFKNFLKAAHQRGIRVIMDLVLNHTSSQNQWFIKSKDPTSPYRNWYVWSDTDPSKADPTQFNYWHSSPGGGFYYGVFSADMPDLNYKNPEVTTEMEKVTKFWLDAGIDGFRLDAAKYLIEDNKSITSTQATHDWFKAYRPFYKGINPQAVTVGEIWSSSYEVLSYLKGDQLDLAFEFDLAQVWVNASLSGDGKQLRDTTKFELGIFPKEQIATFLTNHDQTRVMSTLRDDVNKAKAAATVLLTSPGVPFIYYGEEIGMLGAKPDERIRTPMQWAGDSKGGFTTGTPWETLADKAAQINVASEDKDPQSLLNHYRALIQLRNQHPALRVGDLVKVDLTNNSVYASLRTTDSEAILTLINLSDDPIADVKLNISASILKGVYKVQALLGQGSFASLTATDTGNVVDYKPLTELQANANLVLLLSK